MHYIGEIVKVIPVAVDQNMIDSTQLADISGVMPKEKIQVFVDGRSWKDHIDRPGTVKDWIALKGEPWVLRELRRAYLKVKTDALRQRAQRQAQRERDANREDKP